MLRAWGARGDGPHRAQAPAPRAQTGVTTKSTKSTEVRGETDGERGAFRACDATEACLAARAARAARRAAQRARSARRGDVSGQRLALPALPARLASTRGPDSACGLTASLRALRVSVVVFSGQCGTEASVRRCRVLRARCGRVPRAQTGGNHQVHEVHRGTRRDPRRKGRVRGPRCNGDVKLRAERAARKAAQRARSARRGQVFPAALGAAHSPGSAATREPLPVRSPGASGPSASSHTARRG